MDYTQRIPGPPRKKENLQRTTHESLVPLLPYNGFQQLQRNLKHRLIKTLTLLSWILPRDRHTHPGTRGSGEVIQAKPHLQKSFHL